MTISFQDNEILISGTGIEFLKLKATLASKLGPILKVVGKTLAFPISAIPIVIDLLPLEFRETNAVTHQLTIFQAHGVAKDRALEILDQNVLTGLPEVWLNILDPAQATAVNSIITTGLLGACLFDEQGSGKTVMTIAALDILKERGEVDKMIVVCPKSMVNEWAKDIKRFLGNKYKIIEAEGTRTEKYDSAFRDFDILISNYEGINAMLSPLIAGTNRFQYLLVADESYYLKNGESERSSTIAKLRAFCKKCFVLCGTPAPNSAHDLIHQFNLADLGYTFGSFHKSKSASDDWDKITELVDSRGMFIRRLKEDILSSIPEKHFHVIKVTLTGRQEFMYNQARSELELELRTLDNQSFKKSLLTYFQRRAVLMQICSCPNAVDGTFTETPAKYAVLDPLLHSLIKSGRKVILWSFYRQSINELMTRYAKYRPVRVDGSVSGKDRKLAVNKFQTDPETQLFVGNPSAAGAGITLHASFDAIYMSYSNQAAPYLQSLDRIHRRGQTSDYVNYYLLCCSNTIEETEIKRLRRKELSQHNLLGDHIPWPTSLDEALDELSQHG